MRRSDRSRAPLLLLGLCLVLSCASLRIRTDFDPEADLASFERYAWLEEPVRERALEAGSAPRDPFTHNSLLDQRMRAEIDAQLEARGFQSVGREAADFLLRYQVTSREGLESSPGFVSGGYGGYGTGHYVGGLGVYGGVSSYREGTLLIDFIDPGTERIAWRGWADRRSRGSHIDTERLLAAVEHILAKFPPE